ncbi:protein LTV1 homolog [Cataglyphis hispanica]|uniref:protein LTV1 homolog n=1 Tax=Cataglyphis hispanica TaxID=1086592 RepID=UPI0021807F59|nr:protein LTV1 homolog [Cataglyphis hispanica]XP_050450945.1 protein LTV1 homolog [Cataglyphis hispanica]
MPKGKTKKFIDKKNSVTFHLVHRSQKDPLVADETAPQRVLVPVGEIHAAKTEKKTVDSEKRREEQQKYGIYFDDDYNYLQHLKDVNTLSVEWQRIDNTNHIKCDKDAPKINLPSSVFASNVEEKVGMLNKAAPVSGLQLDLDPDVVAAMDDDFDFDDPENQLEDNFIEMANAGSSDCENSDGEYEYELNESRNEYNESDISSEGNMNLDDEEADDVHSLNGPQYTFKEEETKSRFTEYSISSSVMRRNEQLALLDDKFEQMYAAYDENEIGALDCDEIEGYVAHDSDLILQYAVEFEKKQKEDTENIVELMKDRMKIVEREYPSSEDDDIEKLVVDAREKDKWDCESILSTYSNIYNHPKLIPDPPKCSKKIEIDRKTGVPKNVLGNTGKLTAEALAQFDATDNTLKSSQSIAESRKSTLSVLSIRPKGETPNARKERKKLLKEYRKERRIERKANTEAFKEEKKCQEKIRLNNRQNIHGNRML